MPVAVASLLALAVVPVVDAVFARNRLPFVVAWAVGGVGGAVVTMVGLVMLSASHGGPSEYGYLLEIIFGAIIGAPVGACLATIGTSLAVPPAERRHGTLTGLGMGLAWGWLFVRAVPVDQGGQTSASVEPLAFMAISS